MERKFRDLFFRRLFSKPSLLKLLAASSLSGMYYLYNGPLAPYDITIYGDRAIFTWFYDMPDGITG